MLLITFGVDCDSGNANAYAPQSKIINPLAVHSFGPMFTQNKQLVDVFDHANLEILSHMPMVGMGWGSIVCINVAQHQSDAVACGTESVHESQS